MSNNSNSNNVARINDQFSITEWDLERLNETIEEVARPDLLIDCDKLLVKKIQPKYITLDVLSAAIDGDKVLQTLLHVPGVRDELKMMLVDSKLLVSVIEHLFGKTGTIYPKSPRYSSLDMLAAVKNADHSTHSSDARMLYSGILVHIFDVFEMRQKSTVTSKVIERPYDSNVTPTIEDIIESVTESTVIDKVKFELEKLTKELRGVSTGRQCSMFAFVDSISKSFREMAKKLDAVDFRKGWMHDVFILAGESLLGKRDSIAVYGDLNSNEAVNNLLDNATICRLSVEAYLNNTDTIGIPAHELSNVAAEIGRFLPKLYDYEEITNPHDLVNLVTSERLDKSCLLSNAMLMGTRRSQADTIMYDVVHTPIIPNFVDVTNRTKELSAIRPVIPADFYNTLINHAIAVEQDAVLLKNVGTYNVIAIGRLNIDETLLSDIAAIIKGVSHAFNEKGQRIYEITNSNGRLSAINSGFVNTITTKSATIVAVSSLESTEEAKTVNKYESEALVVNSQFSGLWDGVEEFTKARDISITIKDLLNDSGKGFGTIEVPLLGSPKAVPVFVELRATEGWADIVTLLNAISIELNTAGNVKSKIQRASWVTAILTQLSNWAMNSTAIMALSNRAVMKASTELNQQEDAGMLLKQSSLNYAQIVLQSTLRTLESMSVQAGGPNLATETWDLLVSANSLMQVSSMVKA